MTSVDPVKPLADIAFRVINQDGEEVLTGETTVCQARPRTSG